jgi:hypothetical protein
MPSSSSSKPAAPPSRVDAPVADEGPPKTRSRRAWIWGFVLALVAIEIGVRILGGSRASVEVVNQGSAPMEDLRITCDGREMSVDSIEVGRSVRLRVTSNGPSPFHMTFKQPHCQFSTVDIEEFDARDLQEQGQRLIIAIGDGESSRYCEDTPSFGNRVRRTLRDLGARVP